MIKSIKHLCLLFAALLICACGNDQPTDYDYDIYEVDVNTFLWVRAEPSKKARRLGRVERGEQVRVYDIENGWGRLSIDGYTGYVSADYLKLLHKLKAEPVEPMIAEATTAADTVTPTDEVTGKVSSSMLVDDYAGVLSEADIMRISRVTAESGMKWHILTTPEIPRGEVFDYTSDRLDEFISELNSGKGWWGNMTDNASDSAVVVCYDAANRLLTIESRNTARKYMSLSIPHDLYAAQSAVRNGRSPGEAIENLAQMFLERKAHYADRWFGVRWATAAGSFFDFICDEVLVENILPRDSFWHKWVFGWIFAIPFSIANTLMNLSGTLCGSLLLFILLYGIIAFILNSFSIKMGQYQKTRYMVGVLCSRLAQFALWLTLVSFVVYMQPKLENIVVMENYGYSLETVDNLSSLYADGSVLSGWFIWILFLIGVLIKFCVHSDYALFALFPSNFQRKAYHNQRSSIKTFIDTDDDIELDINELDKDDMPFLTLTATVFTVRFIKVFIPAVPLLFVLNDSLIMYATMFMWTSVVAKAVITSHSYSFARRHNLI